jgi:hypothetical protein
VTQAMHDKPYVLKMLEDVMGGKYDKELVLYDIFSGASDLIDDTEVREKIESALVYLVEHGIITAKIGEHIVHTYLPMLVTETQRRKKTKKPAPCKTGKTPFGPFYDIYNSKGPVMIDFGRMDRTWIRKVQQASPEELRKILEHDEEEPDTGDQGQA